MSDTHGIGRRRIGQGLAALLDTGRTEEDLRMFCQDGDAVLAFVGERCIGDDPAFVAFDAAKRLVFADSKSNPSVVAVVTPEREGYVVTAVSAEEHAAPLVVAMEHRSAHGIEVGTFATPAEAFEAGLNVLYAPSLAYAPAGPAPGF